MNCNIDLTHVVAQGNPIYANDIRTWVACGLRKYGIDSPYVIPCYMHRDDGPAELVVYYDKLIRRKWWIANNYAGTQEDGRAMT